MGWKLFGAGILLIGTFSWAQQTGASSNDGSSSRPASSSSSQKQSQAKDTGSDSSHQQPSRNPHLDPPRSDRVNASALEDGESSSKDTQIDLSPPADDTKSHPRSSDVLVDEGSGSTNMSAFRYWDPHKAAKDVEVGDFYFKRKNYKAAEDRYREALLYKDNDAMATFRLAECLDKMGRPGEAQQVYENYLKILPHGPEAEKAEKSIERLKGTAENLKPAK